MAEGYEIISIKEDTWRIEDHGVRFFLLVGEEKALLIDSGMQVQNAKEIAESLTSLPIELINTHADPDHIGSNHEFEAPYMNPAELTNYQNSQKRTGDITPVWDGDVIELGNRTLKIIALPGHTPGSIAILDEKYHALFSGDPIQDGNIFMFGVQRNMTAYRHSLLRLKKCVDQVDVIYPSHGTFPVPPSIVDELIEASENIMAKKIEPKEGDMFGTPIHIYDAGVAKFLCD